MPVLESHRLPAKLTTAAAGRVRPSAIFHLALSLALLLTACDRAPGPVEEIRPVRTIVAEMKEFGQVMEGVGEIRPRLESDIGFRTGGKVVERPVNVGDRVRRGALLARIDDVDQRNQLLRAQADVDAARAGLDEAVSDEQRNRQLLEKKLVPQARYDTAVNTLNSSRARVDSAMAQLRLAQDQLAYARLTADDDGVVTATGAEPGQVVASGQMVVRLAHQSQKDAVFNVSEEMVRMAPKDPPVEVSLLSDPAIRIVGRVREIAPEADPVTRTFAVKVDLAGAPPDMLLGAMVRGAVRTPGNRAVALPPSALVSRDGAPAVWRFDPATETVELVPVEVSRYETGQVLIGAGIETGDRIVTAGVHRLHPGQKVRLLGGDRS